MPKQRQCGHTDIVMGIRQSGPRKGLPYSCCLSCVRNRNRSRTKAEQRHYNLSRYGITPADYDTLLLKQGGKCAICRQPERTVHKGKLLRLSVDHNHITNIVRGLLCCACNRAIGCLQDSLLIVESAATYLRTHA